MAYIFVYIWSDGLCLFTFSTIFVYYKIKNAMIRMFILKTCCLD